MSGCHGTRDLLPAFVEGALRGDELAAVEAHLEACTACR